MHPAMLTEYGCRELRNITLKGNKRGGSKKEWVDVHYDTEYVIQKVIVEVFKPLLITEHLQMKRILSLAWKQYTVQCLNKEDKPFY
jgi:folate-dependent phosphoribosylglycinamide formyltransferase PurN